MPLDLDRVRVALERLDQKLAPGQVLQWRESTTSTMDDVRALLEGSDRPLTSVLIGADEQLSGRGSRGREWSSPPGDDLYWSFGWVRKHTPPPALTLAVGLGIARTAEQYAGAERVRIKWPNDVLVNGHKIAGILTEAQSLPARVCQQPPQGLNGGTLVVIGVGLNVNRREFGSLEATSLAAVTGAPIEREEVLARAISEIARALQMLDNGQIGTMVNEVNERLAYRGSTVTVDDSKGELEGVALNDGALLLRVDGATKRIYSGTLRPSRDRTPSEAEQ